MVAAMERGSSAGYDGEHRGDPEFVELYIGNGVWQTVNRRSVGY